MNNMKLKYPLDVTAYSNGIWSLLMNKSPQKCQGLMKYIIVHRLDGEGLSYTQAVELWLYGVENNQWI